MAEDMASGAMAISIIIEINPQMAPCIVGGEQLAVGMASCHDSMP